MDSSKTTSRPNPRAKASSISILLWWWTVRIFKKGYTSVLSLDDLYEPLKTDRSTYLGDRLEKQWNKQLNESERNKSEPILLKTIFLTFRKEILFMGVLHLFLDIIFSIASPILLGFLLKYFKSDATLTFKDALLYASALSTNCILTLLLNNHSLFYAYHLGGRIRIAVCSLVYRKALQLSKTAFGETSPGKIVNLVANDVNRFDFVMMYLHNMWTTPLVILIVAYILYREAHVAALLGIAVLLATVPIQVYCGKLSAQYRLSAAIRTDERIRLIDEIISGIQVIKMYAWEKPFCALVELARKLELKIIRKTSFLRGLFMNFIIFTARASMYCTVLSMLLHGEPLTADKIFVFASFYDVLNTSMSVFFVRCFTEISECKVSVARIQSFMLLDDYEISCITNTEKNINDKNCSLPINNADEEKYESFPETDRKETWSIRINNVTAKWCSKSTENTLENIDLRLEKGKLYALIGLVGSGKSSLLSAILREMSLIEGDIKVRGDVSYVSQDAWVFGSSVRQNILFGQEFDGQKYQQVVKACSLNNDFVQFPEGDRTIVGERGCSLSGGQKARINLARSVYRQADVYLLDNPLSAVDAHVGRHLFEECIKRYLRGTTTILVTHQLQFVKDVDGIILLDQGRMQYYKNYQELFAAYPEYNSLIAADEDEDGTLSEEEKRTELKRRLSSTSNKSTKVSESEDVEVSNQNDDVRNLADVMEATSKGAVKGNVYLQYFRTGSNICITFFMILLYLTFQFLVSSNDFMLSYIVNVEESRRLQESHRNKTSSQKNEMITIPENDFYPTEYYVYAYTFIVVGIFVIGLVRVLIYFTLCMRSSERLHNSAFAAVIRTTMRFFDTNPSGCILNRFSKDTSAMDEVLPRVMLDAGKKILQITGAVILACFINPIFLIPALIVGTACYWINKIYLKTSKNIKRLEGMTRSLVFTHLSATLNGISTIRACGAQNILKLEFDKFQDVHTSFWYMFTACSIAFAFALDLFAFSFTTFITYSFLFVRDNFNGGEVGLAITQMISIGVLVQLGMLQSAEVTNQITSVERILEYTQIPPELYLRSANETTKRKKIRTKKLKISDQFFMTPKDWSCQGVIEFKNVFMRYSEDEEPVLKCLNFHINSMEKVGIVGRTGAGKSSLISALFRLAPIEGNIEIDNVDTGTISLEDLRRRICIIPQDPVLFSGTLRQNLDPFKEFSVTALWSALEEVELKKIIEVSGSGLNYKVLNRGSNFSVGQRQLVCLARAVLRNNRVLVLDEATANVDPQTDALIQKTIRKKFAYCTVLTVAHRLNTIIDSDKVIVMDKGHLVEFDHPYVLLQNKNGVFYSLVKETGDIMFRQLFELAKQYYQEKNFTYSSSLRQTRAL